MVGAYSEGFRNRDFPVCPKPHMLLWFFRYTGNSANSHRSVDFRATLKFGDFVWEKTGNMSFSMETLSFSAICHQVV